MTKSFLYVDLISNTGEVIYVGIGNIDRINVLKRNIKHQRISNKYKVQRDILLCSYDYEWLKIQEILAIKYYNTRNTRHGCNFTMGGDGTRGYKWTELQRDKIRGVLSWNSNKPGLYTKEHRNKISKANIGHTCSEHTKSQISKANIGNTAFLGKHHSSNTKLKMSRTKNPAHKEFSVHFAIIKKDTIVSYKTEDLVGVFKTIKDITEKLKIPRRSILRCLRKARNATHSHSFAFRGNSIVVNKVTLVKTLDISYKKGTFIKSFLLISDAAKYFNIKNGCISRCLKGSRQQANGYIFKYI